MEYVKGASLSKLTAEKVRERGAAFATDEVTDWVRHLCGALDYAHAKARIVHRDLKPANLMINQNSELKVADFGIACSLRSSHSRITQAKSTSGTIAYMSPQQMMGEIPSVTDDVYSLGSTLYEVLTGRPPFFSGEIYLQVIEKIPKKISDQRNELEMEGSTVPEEWEETIASCLAKEPRDRPSSCGEVAALLGIPVYGETSTTERVFGRTEPAISLTEETSTNEFPAPSRGPEKREKTTGNRLLTSVLLVLILIVIGVTGYFVHFLKRGAVLPTEEPVDDTVSADFPKKDEVEPIAVEPVSLTEAEPAVEIEEKGVVDEPEVATVADISDGYVPGLLELNGNEMVLYLPGSVGLRLHRVPIPEKPFLMGSPSEEIGHRPWEEFREVRMEDSFFVGIKEITQSQYNAVLGRAANPSYWIDWIGNDDWPVDSVDWEDIMGSGGFIERLNLYLEGKKLSQFSADLPTEGEWEYTCRAGTRTAFNNNTQITDPVSDPNLEGVAHYNRVQGVGSPAPVGTYSPNSWGFYDMHGNLAEWCKGESSGSGMPVLRGGGWNQRAGSCRSASRAPATKTQKGQNWHGFRIVIREASK